MSDIDTTHDAVDTVEIPSSLAKDTQVETAASLAAKRRNLRGDGSDQLWPFSTGSTYHDHHDLVGIARLLELPEKFLSNRLRVSEILDAVGIWLMRRALA